MNRYSRYTYKGKRKDGQGWICGSLIYNNDTDKYFIDYSIVEDYDSSSEFDEYNCGLRIFVGEIIPETLCQCTGLQDKNGNYIFENDILRCKTKWGGKPMGSIYKMVKWNGAGFNITSKISERWLIVENKFDEVK